MSLYPQNATVSGGHTKYLLGSLEVDENSAILGCQKHDLLISRGKRRSTSANVIVVNLFEGEKIRNTFKP